MLSQIDPVDSTSPREQRRAPIRSNLIGWESPDHHDAAAINDARAGYGAGEDGRDMDE